MHFIVHKIAQGKLQKLIHLIEYTLKNCPSNVITNINLFYICIVYVYVYTYIIILI